MLQVLKISSLCMALVISSMAQAGDQTNPLPQVSDQWRFELTPYLWAPAINSTLNYNGQYLQTAKVSSSNVISNLKSGGMIAGEAHSGNWGVMADLVSATLQKSGSIPVTPKPGVVVKFADTATVQQTILTGAATYTLLKDSNIYMDGLIGARWVAITASINLSLSSPPVSGSDSKAMSTADPIAGFKGRYRIADSTWYIPFYADIGSGGGTTNVTWQAMLGVGKKVTEGVDASLVYRSLFYDMDSSKTNGQGLLQKTTFQGPQLAVTINF